jgi:hypothetical protein
MQEEYGKNFRVSGDNNPDNSARTAIFAHFSKV